MNKKNRPADVKAKNKSMDILGVASTGNVVCGSIPRTKASGPLGLHAGFSVFAIMAALTSFNAQADVQAAGSKVALFINDNEDSKCTSIHDNYGSDRDDGRINRYDDPGCQTSDKATQNWRALFYGSSGSGHSDSLTLGSELFVNGSATLKNLSVANTRIKNVSNGIDSSDAVNLGQLNSTRIDLTDLTTGIASGTIGLLKQDPSTLKLTVAASTGGTEIDFGGTGGARKLTNVQQGTAAGDAVNYGQLSTTNTTVANLTTNITNGTIGLLHQATSSSNLSIASSTGGTEIDIGGTSGARKLTNVQQGTLSGDAVNYGQLSATNTTVANLTTDITNGTIGLLHQATPSSNMSIASSTGGGEIDIAGTDGARKIVHVRSGTASGDAVNYGQLSTTNANVLRLTQNIDRGVIGLVQQLGPSTKLTVASSTGGNEVDFGSSQGGRKLTNVDAGTASGEAVNFDQLNETNLQVANLADSFAKNKSLLEQPDPAGKLTLAATTGGTEIDISGTSGSRKITHLMDGSDDSDAVAFGQLRATNTTLANLASAIDGGTVGLVQQMSATSKVTVASLTGGDEVDFGGNMGARRLTHVADGVEANDAVNVGQLSAITSMMKSMSNASSLSAPMGRSTQGSGDAGDGTTAGDTSAGQSYSQSSKLMSRSSNAAMTTTTPISGGAQTQSTQQTSSTSSNRSMTASPSAASGVAALSIAAHLGGGATYDATTDTVTAPVYNVQGASHNNVGSALSALDNATTTNTATLNRIANGTAGIVRQEGAASGTGTIHVGQDTGGTRVDLKNSAGERRVLTGLADGELSANSKDAVTGSQLFATNEAIKGINAGDGIKNFHSSSTGPDAVAGGQGSTAVGGGAATSADNAIALGQNANVTAANSVALGAGSVADRGAEIYQPMYFNNGATFTSAGTVSVGSQGAERVIANVAPGVRATDAANVGQLKGLSDAVADRLDSMQRTYGRAIASTAALSFQPVQQRPGQFVMSAGVGYFQGYSALGVGGNYLFRSGRQKLYGGVSGSSGGRPVVQVGFSAAFGD